MNATKSVKPATGRVRWMGKAANGHPLLMIQAVRADGAMGPEQVYEVSTTPGGFYLLRVTPEGYVRYKISCGRPWTCDCPDATKRHPSGCKHVRGLRAALNAEPF